MLAKAGRVSIVGDWRQLALRRVGRRRAVLYRESDGVGSVVHGGDFTFEGPAEALASIPDDLRKSLASGDSGLTWP